MTFAHSGRGRLLRFAHRFVSSFLVVLCAALALASGPAFAGRMLYTGGHWIYPDWLSTHGGNTMTQIGNSDTSYTQAFAGAYGAFDALVVGEGSPVPSPTVRAQIVNYVNNGGRVIVIGSHGGQEVAFLNAVFGYATAVMRPCEWDDSPAGTLQPGAVGTPFEGGPAVVYDGSCTTHLVTGTTPGIPIYAGDGITAFMHARGSGAVMFLGWDFCCGGSNVFNSWYPVINRAINGGIAPPVPQPPSAANDFYSVAEDGTLVAGAPGVLTNDRDPEGAPISAALVAGPAHAASFTLNPNGSFQYVPRDNFTGADSFTYRASDGALQSGVATVTITVTPVNDAPVATNDVYNTDEDVALVVPAATGVLANDNDVDGPSLSAVLVTGPEHGTLSLRSDGSFTYTPAPNYNGPDSFTYRATDGALSSAVTMVNIGVLPVNDITAAMNDAYALDEDGALSVPAKGVLANDVDPDVGEVLTVELVDSPSHAASFALGPDGSFNYAPAANFNGSDTFTYRVNDQGVYSFPAMVVIQVRPVNDPPTSTSGPMVTPEDTAATMTLRASDVDSPSLTFSIVSPPLNGTITLGAPSCASIAAGSECSVQAEYVPPPNFHGSASFSYVVSDGPLRSPVVTVAITVTPVNDPPVAHGDSATTAEDGSVTTPVTANDTDLDGDALSVSSFTQGANGTVSCSGGNCTYTPNPNFNGTDSYTYTASDGNGGSSTATVTVIVVAVNDPPLTPAVTSPSPAILENGVATLGVAFVNVDAGDTHNVSVNWGDGTVETLALGTSVSFTLSHRYLDDNAADGYPVTIKITDAAGASVTLATTVAVANVAPVITAVTGPAAPAAAGSPVTVSATYTDVGTLDTHTCTFSWDDGTPNTVVAGSGGVCTATHTYAAANVNEVTVTVTDDDGGSASDAFRYVVVYDASAGFVTGGGWFTSPAGAYALDLAATGRANFGFVSKYKAGQSVPSGNTEFQFKAGNINFKSTAYEWMVISGSKARYRGTGTINGAGAYSFELTGWDGERGDPDRIRMQIWDQNRGNALLYDNQAGAEPGADPTTILGGGSIQIHR